MSYSSTYNETTTFTATNAKYLASKVATDLKRMQRFYGSPSDFQIEEFELEIIELLKKGYLKSVTYGFKRNGSHIEPTLKYLAQDFSNLNMNDDDPGKVRPGADISGASFYSFLIYSEEWHKLPYEEKEKFEYQLPFKRGGAQEPGINGYLSEDKTYSSGGRSLNRFSVKNY
jgi:hypothetical protein